jgi:hypothetical protein
MDVSSINLPLVDLLSMESYTAAKKKKLVLAKGHVLNVASVTSVAYGKCDNELNRLMKGLCDQSSPQMGSVFSK